VIHFVLNSARLVSFHVKRVLIAFAIKGMQMDAFRTHHVAGVIRDRKTAFPAQGKPLPFGNFGVNQDQVAVAAGLLATRYIHDDNAFEPVHLWRCNPHGTGTGKPCFLQIGDTHLQGIVELRDRLRDLAQPFIWVDENIQDSHVSTDECFYGLYVDLDTIGLQRCQRLLDRIHTLLRNAFDLQYVDRIGFATSHI